MDCLSDLLLQQYLDNEVPGNEQHMVADNLAGCIACRERLEDMSLEKEEIGEILSVLAPAEIPVVELRRRPSISRTLWPLIPASAASVVLLILLFGGQKRNIESALEIERTVYEYMSEQDPNLMWQGKAVQIIIERENGEVVISQ